MMSTATIPVNDLLNNTYPHKIISKVVKPDYTEIVYIHDGVYWRYVREGDKIVEEAIGGEITMETD